MTEQEQITQKKEKKKISEKLAKILDQIGRGFAKLDESIKKALRIGKEEGLTEKETGDLIREAMKKGGYTTRTIRNHLPKGAKHVEKTKKSLHKDEEKDSSYEHDPKSQNVTTKQEPEKTGTVEEYRKITEAGINATTGSDTRSETGIVLDDSEVFQCDDWPVEDFVMRDANHYTRKYLQRAYTHLGRLIQELKEKEKMV